MKGVSRPWVCILISSLGFQLAHVASGSVLQENVFGYISQPHDATAHVVMLGGYRAYNAQQGVFLKQDSYSPFVSRQTINGFDYGAGNPVFRVDPSGHLSKTWTYVLIAVGAVIVLAAVAYGAYKIGYAQGMIDVLGPRSRRMLSTIPEDRISNEGIGPRSAGRRVENRPSLSRVQFGRQPERIEYQAVSSSSSEAGTVSATLSNASGSSSNPSAESGTVSFTLSANSSNSYGRVESIDSTQVGAQSSEQANTDRV